MKDNNTVPVAAHDLRPMRDHCHRIGTLLEWSDIAIGWAEGASTRIAELERANDELRAALVQARQALVDWGAYADEYYRDKHNFLGDLDDINRALKQADEPPPGGSWDERGGFPPENW